MSKSQELHPLYFQAPILIHSTGETVTKEKIEKIFNYMNIEFDIKIAEKFELSKQEYENFYFKLAN